MCAGVCGSLLAPAGVSRPSLSRAAMCAGVCGTLQLIPVGWLPRHSGRCLLVVVSTRRLLNSEVGQCTSWSLSPHWPGASLPVIVPFNSGSYVHVNRPSLLACAAPPSARFADVLGLCGAASQAVPSCTGCCLRAYVHCSSLRYCGTTEQSPVHFEYSSVGGLPPLWRTPKQKSVLALTCREDYIF